MKAKNIRHQTLAHCSIDYCSRLGLSGNISSGRTERKQRLLKSNYSTIQHLLELGYYLPWQGV